MPENHPDKCLQCDHFHREDMCSTVDNCAVKLAWGYQHLLSESILLKQHIDNQDRTTKHLQKVIRELEELKESHERKIEVLKGDISELKICKNVSDALHKIYDKLITDYAEKIK